LSDDVLIGYFTANGLRAAVFWRDGVFHSGTDLVTRELLESWDRSGSLEWVGPETRDWFYFSPVPRLSRDDLPGRAALGRPHAPHWAERVGSPSVADAIMRWIVGLVWVVFGLCDLWLFVRGPEVRAGGGYVVAVAIGIAVPVVVVVCGVGFLLGTRWGVEGTFVASIVLVVVSLLIFTLPGGSPWAIVTGFGLVSLVVALRHRKSAALH
jgi:hypothetical protein